MNRNSAETGITNLGMVPIGYTFAQATEAVKHKRKYFIDPDNGGHRLTICDTLRMMWREIEKLPVSEETMQIKEYIAQAFDYGKRMDARMKYLKKELEKAGIDYTVGG